MVCPSLRLLRNEQQSNSCRLMICTLGAETGIKVVRGRQGQGGACGQIGSLPLLGGCSYTATLRSPSNRLGVIGHLVPGFNGIVQMQMKDVGGISSWLKWSLMPDNCRDCGEDSA